MGFYFHLFQLQICPPRSCVVTGHAKVVWTPFINLWLGEGVQNPFYYTMVPILLELLESFVNNFLLWMELNWKKMLPNWISIGHSTHRVRRTLVEFQSAWWDLAGKRYWKFLVPNRWKKSNWQQYFVQWNNCLTTDTWQHPAVMLQIWMRLHQFISSWHYSNVDFNGGSAAMKEAFWAHCQFMKKLWDRWIKEYLPQLTTIKKWATEEKRPMAVWDLVWFCHKQYHPFNYPMGRILEIHIGDDEVSRSATVKNNRKKFQKQPANLVRLAIDSIDMIVATKNMAGDVAVGDWKILRHTILFLIV